MFTKVPFGRFAGAKAGRGYEQTREGLCGGAEVRQDRVEAGNQEAQDRRRGQVRPTRRWTIKTWGWARWRCTQRGDFVRWGVDCPVVHRTRAAAERHAVKLNKRETK